MSQPIIIQGATIFDGSGVSTFQGDVLIEGNRIRTVVRGAGSLSTAGCQIIPAQDKFLMPGMTEGHAHLSFDNATSTEDLISPPTEEHVLITARVAERLLNQGFTSAWGASEAKLRLGVAIRNEINAGRLKGPRIRAGSLEITVTGDLGDESKLHNPRNVNNVSPSIVIDGPEAMRKAVRLCCREGCDNMMTMGTDEKLGKIKQGYLVDMILVDGDPLKDPAVIVDANNLAVIIKDGVIHKSTL